ncbi:hypothetical protein SDC9_212172 [bioreactor metagenome]|uniref:Uncharacterized protein n=1 Tax=bioreactor metagenome TaxID=1076179 RepID=A0A645JMT6_9ZZZZ
MLIGVLKCVGHLSSALEHRVGIGWNLHNVQSLSIQRLAAPLRADTVGETGICQLVRKTNAQHAVQIVELSVFADFLHSTVRAAFVPESRNIRRGGIALRFCYLLLFADDFERVFLFNSVIHGIASR